MQDLVLRAERVASHSRGHFLRLCSFCHQAVASAEAPVRGGLLCAHPGALLLEARLRLVTLGRGDGPPDRPDGPALARRVGGPERAPALLFACVAGVSEPGRAGPPDPTRPPRRVGRVRRALRDGRFETRAVAQVA